MYLGESFKAILKEYEIHPTYYDERMSDVDAHIWQKAMETKLEFIHSNQVWELIESPERIKPIRCKCVYKRKGEIDG